MSPSVNFGDSGEFIAAAATLSVAHAPGYPLMSLLGRAVGTLLPLAGWAYRVNLASLLASSAALGIFFAALGRAGLSRTAAAGGALWLGLSALWLHTSLQAEVFALNALFAACAFWLFCAYRESILQPRPMAALGLVLGLGGANHHTLILVVAAFAAGLLCFPRAYGKARLASAAAWFLGLGALGLAAYAYLPIRSAIGPPLDWGHPAALDRFLHVLLRRDYGSFSLTVEGAGEGRLAGALKQVIRLVRELYGSFGAVGCVLALLGALRRDYPKRALYVFAFSWFFFAGPVFLWLGNPPFDAQTEGALKRFYLLPWFGAAFFVAEGIARLREGLPEAARRFLPALLLLPPLGAAAKAPAWEMRWDLAAYDYGRNIFRSLPPGSALFIDGGDDTFYTTAEQLYARSLRPDLKPHDRGGLVFPNPYGADFRRLDARGKEERRREVEAAFALRRPTFYATLGDELLPGRSLGHWGLLRRADKDEDRPGLWELYVTRHDEGRAASYYRYRALMPVYGILRGAEEAVKGDVPAALTRLRAAYSGARDVAWVRDTASKRAEWAGYRASGRGDWSLAEQAYLFALALRPDQTGVWLNLGVTREKRELWDAAEEAYRQGLARGGDPFQSYYNLGTLYWKRRMFAESAEMFSRASQRRPEDAGARIFARRALKLSGR